MERITSPGRIISILIQESISSGYSQLFNPASRVKLDKEKMRYSTQLYTPNAAQLSANVLINKAITLNALLIEDEDKDVFYPNNYWFRISKRAFDIVFSLAVIVFVLSWLLPIIAMLVKFESAGAFIFTQQRSSRNNKTFDCYKFRSMLVNDECNILQTSSGDARITKVGAFLRRYNLDELPQFFNVLIGNMSVVGPRPHMLSQTKEYSEVIDNFMIRHFVKPGITGWAQVNGLRGKTTTVHQMHNRVKADVWYLKNWTFLLDMKIIVLTIFFTITGNKSAH